MRLLDRYVLRIFLRAYLFCIVAFLAIWIVFDISDKLATFLDDNVAVSAILRYYLAQLPSIVVVVLPVALLLAVVATLGRMSRTNEIVSMLTAGVSIPRLLLPIVAMALLTVAISAGLNHSLAPHAEVEGRGFYQEMRGREDERDLAIHGLVFRNRAANRTWFVQRFMPSENLFDSVQVLQQDGDDNIETSYMAPVAVFHPETHSWELRDVKIVKYDHAGEILHEEFQGNLFIADWDETPFRLESSTMRAEHLSVPELRAYLRYNADFPETLLAPFATYLYHRAALPWTCLVIVLLAAPLAIGLSRKGIFANVATAIALLFSLNFLTHLFLALGEGDRIAAWWAAWTPNVVFGLLALVFLYIRSSNRELREFNPFAARRLATS